MTNEILAIDRRISHLQEARALLADFLKTEQIRKYRGHRKYFGNLDKKAMTRTSPPTIREEVDPGLLAARKARLTSATKPAKSAATKLASVPRARTISSASKPKPGKKKAR
jgi:hypothetical protein